MPKILNIDSKNKRFESSKDIIKDLTELEKLKQKRKENKPLVVVEFSWQLLTILILALVIIFAGKQLVTVGLFLFVGLVVMSALRPIVKWLMKRKFSKSWAVTLTYFLAFLAISGLISAVVLPFVGEINDLVQAIPNWVNRFVTDFSGVTIAGYTLDLTMLNTFVSDYVNNFDIQSSFQSIAGTLGSVFSWTSLLLAAVVFSIYLVIDHDSLLQLGLIRITSDQKRGRVKQLVVDVEEKLGRWLLGQATVSTIAGLVSGIILAVMGVPFALPLAVFIALMDAIPNFGAIIAGIPAVLVTFFALGPWSALLLVVLLAIYQQIENNLVIPRVMGNAVGIKPVLIMITAISFLILFGIWGAILAVPVLVIMQIIYEFYIDLQKLEAKGSI
jgi:predicted PurR-regulated permease PerM